MAKLREVATTLNPALQGSTFTHLTHPPKTANCQGECQDSPSTDNKKMPSFFNYPELYDRLIVLDGWSKTYAMTGWRLGWSVWPEEFIEKVTRMAINSYSCVSAANQVAAMAALDGPHDFLDDMMEKMKKHCKAAHGARRVAASRGQVSYPCFLRLCRQRVDRTACQRRQAARRGRHWV